MVNTAIAEDMDQAGLPEGYRNQPENLNGSVVINKADRFKQTKQDKDIIDKLKDTDTEVVDKILSEKFIFQEDVARILSRAFRTGKNVILWGPPGHAKSAMVMQALKGLDLEDQAYILDFGEGMDEPTLWGGLNFKRLHEEHVLDFNPERSFLNYPVVVFEELFDAPPQVLCALKNTLTAKKLYKSDDPFPMKTHVIIACTNKSPAEIAALGESAKALIERFPLQLKMEWPEYSARNYTDMFNRIGIGDQSFNAVFGELISNSGKKGAPISPRTAVHAHQVVCDAANEKKMNKPDAQALSYLSYVPGLEDVGKKKSQEYAEQLITEEAQRIIEATTFLITQTKEEAELISDAEQLLEKVVDLSEAETELNKMACPKKLSKEFQQALKSIQDLSSEISDKALKVAVSKKRNNRR